MKSTIASTRRSAAQDVALDAMTIGTTALTLLLVACVLVRNAATLAL